MQHIGEWIKRERTRRGWTQEELGSKLRVTRQYVSILEKRRSSGNVNDLLFVRICEVLGPIPDELPCANEWQSHFLEQFKDEERLREQARNEATNGAVDPTEAKIDKLLADACWTALRPVVMSRRRGCRTYLIQIDQEEGPYAEPLDEEKLLQLANVFTIFEGVNGDAITVHEIDEPGTKQSGTGLQPVNRLQTHDSRLTTDLNHFLTPLGPTDRL